MMKEPPKKTTIDWEACTAMLGNLTAAQDFIRNLALAIPDEIKAIKASHQKKEYDQLSKQTHHLHGSVCYSGSNTLKSAAHHLEVLLKSKPLNHSAIQTAVDALEKETTHFLSAAKEHEAA